MVITVHDIAEALRYAREHNKFPDVNINCDTSSDDPPSDDDTLVIIYTDERKGSVILTLEATYEHTILGQESLSSEKR